RHVRTDASMNAETETEVPVSLTVEDDFLGGRKDLRVAVGHRPRQPETVPFFQLCPGHHTVLGHGPSVARGGCEVAKELFGGRIEKTGSLTAEQFPLVRIL